MKTRIAQPLKWMLMIALAAACWAIVAGCSRQKTVPLNEDAVEEEPVEENKPPQQTKSKAPNGVIALETRWEGGVLTMPCTVNGLRLRFIFDTGASSVCISSTEALFMLKNGYLDENDIGEEVQSIVANGDIVDSTEITLREIEVGGIVLHDIKAIVSHGIDAPLLFGQSAIRKLGTIQIRDGEVTIIPGTGQGIVGNMPTSQEETDYDPDEYKQRGWLIQRDGAWYLADNVPIEARLKFYRTEAKYGDTSKMCALGRLYEEGLDVPQNFEESFKWYQQAANFGEAYAQYITGYNYRHGRGVKQDDAMAAHWYGRAAAQGQIDAQLKLGLMYEKGEGVTKSEVTAVDWYKKAAENGNVDAQACLGACYYKGMGVSKNGQQAAYWFKQAANQGDTFSLWSLGLMYEYGEGVPIKKGLALNYYKQAADLGNMTAAKSYQRLLEEKREHDRRVREEREFQQWMRQ